MCFSLLVGGISPLTHTRGLNWVHFLILVYTIILLCFHIHHILYTSQFSYILYRIFIQKNFEKKIFSL
nr:MAG TPA: hypothetical protein [Caudoviricetes sp.]